MPTRNFIPLFGCLMLVFSACSSTKQIEALKPSPSYSNEIIYDKQVSFCNMPVEITMNDLQNQTNKYLNGLIYEDNVLEDDNFMMKVWKQAPIIISEKNGKIELELPLKIWTKVRYGFEKMGISAYDTKDINLNGKIKLNSSVTFKNWKFSTATSITGLEWSESPSITVAGKNIPITYLINPAVNLFKDKIAKMIDASINKSLDVKPYIYQALEQISKPVEVNTEYHVWFGMQPLELYTNQAIIANKKISVVLGMKAFMETAINAKPSVNFDKSKLMLMGAEKLPEDFGVAVASVITYPNAAALMQTNFNGKRFESGGRSVTINKIDIWGKDGKMIIELGMTGSVNGNFYLSGVPSYDAVKKEIYFDQLDFVLDSKNKLLKIGNWLAHGTIVKKIQDNCRYSIAEQLQNGELTLKKYLTNYQPVSGVKVNGNLYNLTPQKVTLTPNAIVTIIEAKGKVAISVNGM